MLQIWFIQLYLYWRQLITVTLNCKSTALQLQVSLSLVRNSEKIIVFIIEGIDYLRQDFIQLTTKKRKYSRIRTEFPQKYSSAVPRSESVNNTFVSFTNKRPPYSLVSLLSHFDHLKRVHKNGFRDTRSKTGHKVRLNKTHASNTRDKWHVTLLSTQKNSQQIMNVNI